MRAVVHAFYSNPVLFLGALAVGLSVAAAEGAISGWVVPVALGVVSFVQRHFVSPAKV